MTIGSCDALLVIDVQNDFCPAGALAVGNGDAVVPVINALMPHFQTVILTQDWHPAGHSSFASAHAGAAPFSEVSFPYGPQTLWPDHCIQNTGGADFHPSLNQSPAQVVVRKGMRAEIDSYSAFFENDRTTPTGLHGLLMEKGITRVFGCGLATDYCVAYSLLDARRLGLEAVLIEDASRGIDLNGSLAQALKDLRAAGVQVIQSAQL